jgi:hypothetical protein
MMPDDPNEDAIREGDPPYFGHTTRVADARISDNMRRGDASECSIAITILLVGISQLLFLTWFGTMLFLVPGFERDFLDLKVKLPYVTEMSIAGSRWTVKYWYAAITAIAMSGAISCLVRQRVGNGMWSVIWFGFLIGFPLIGHLFVWISLFLPQL